ncbi:hypothetical protein AABB24_020292, partial [Solanum stoloniferum]
PFFHSSLFIRTIYRLLHIFPIAAFCSSSNPDHRFWISVFPQMFLPSCSNPSLQLGIINSNYIKGLISRSPISKPSGSIMLNHKSGEATSTIISSLAKRCIRAI